ncbi:hypothetical protein BJV74DRAFT_773704 [Russula compacta]|nr:hypothetical protein BJV74DRAFT_773704 [Russula compacta]
MPGPVRKSFMRNWWAVEAIPIYCVVGATVLGCGWYLTHLARGPHVIWTKSNPTPWNNVKQDENVKLMSVNQKFEKRFVSWCSYRWHDIGLLINPGVFSWTRDRL